jgi:hypothetical protein
MSEMTNLIVEKPHIEWSGDRPFAFSRLTEQYANALEKLALEKEAEITSLPVNQGWETVADRNPTTSRFGSYSAFLLSPLTLPLFFAIQELYRFLLQELDQKPAPRFIQCWYNIHRIGDSLVRHKHVYPFIGTFSACAEGSVTRYGRSKEPDPSDALIEHVRGLLMVTTGLEHWHDTSPWQNPDRARVTFAFDVVDVSQWNPRQIFLPFDNAGAAADQIERSP